MTVTIMTFADNNRQLIANEAARLLYEEGYRDYWVAKKRAAQRLGCSADKVSQPSNMEIHEALLLRCHTLASEKVIGHLQNLRRIALEAMEFLHSYSPLLVGSVTDGTAGLYSPATLHLFSPTVEEVMFFLQDNQLPFQTHERMLRIRGVQVRYPLLRFYADDFEIELLIFEEEAPPPVSAITGKAVKRLSVEEVKKLIASQGLKE